MSSESVPVIHRCGCEICRTGANPGIVRHHWQMNLFLSRLNEPQRRWSVGLLSQKPGSPSDRQLSLITGLDEKTIRYGRQEIEDGLADLPYDRQRRAGGGRPPVEEKDPELETVLLDIVSPHTAGDPMSSRKWLNCRLVDIQERLAERGHRASPPVISRLLKKHDYRLRANAKEREGKQHPDRNRQFEYIRGQEAKHQAAGHPVINVDAKKKELVGDFKNPGRIWCQTPEQVNIHDFPSDAVGRAVPYGIYDRQHNRGTVYVGQSADTPAFAVDNIAHWCQTEWLKYFPDTTHLMLKADCGGSNSCRSRVWKRDLQEKVADRFGLTITVCHYPTGASKWNPVEHRLFSEISKTWAGCPLRSFDDVLHYIRDTKTQTGLTVEAHLVTQTYEKGVKVSDDEMDALNIQFHDVCPQWNYTIHPRPTPTLT
jgi:hypothetical protein